MPGLPYYIEARDAAGAPLAGLKPTWQFLETSTNVAVTPLPAIVEKKPGLYVTMIDPATTGEAAGRVDLGPTASERYHTLAIYPKTDTGQATLDTATIQAIAKAVVALLPAPVVTPAVGPLTLDAATLDALGKAVAAHVIGTASVTVPPETVRQIADAVVAALPAPAATPQATLDALTAAAKSLADLAGKLGNPGKGNKG